MNQQGITEEDKRNLIAAVTDSVTLLKYQMYGISPHRKHVEEVMERAERELVKHDVQLPWVSQRRQFSRQERPRGG